MSSNSPAKPPIPTARTQGSLFILHYKARCVLVGSPTDYHQLQDAIRSHFPDIPADHRVSYHSDELEICKGALVEVSEEIWESAIPLLNTLTVQSEPKATAFTSSRSLKRPLIEAERDSEAPCPESDDSKPPGKKPRRDDRSVQVPSVNISTQENGKMRLKIFRGDTGERFAARCKPSTSISWLLSGIYEEMGSGLYGDFTAIWGGSRLCDGDKASLEGFGLRDGDQIDVFPVQKGGKPVIYLFPPSDSQINASVTLSLVPEWHFSGIYPAVPINCLPSGGQILTWNVNAAYDGTLLEMKTGLEVAYLFWEAEALAQSTMVPPNTPLPASGLITADETFVPTHAQVVPINSVVLEVAKITPYLDSALKALGLHVEARTSFITYWLPSFLKHKHIALRFLPQSTYERAAPLVISPAPDVVVRVFMLFKGLREDQVSRGGWKHATEGGVTQWKSVVGIDESRKLDDGSLFRVVEWGGMEVLQ